MNFEEMVNQAKQLQTKMEKIREEAAQKTAEGTAGGGMVTVTVNGRNQVLSIQIDPEVVDKGEVEMLQDLVVAATNQALSRAQEIMEQEMSTLTGGLALPGVF
ncbi:MAG: YbaB/EbfC family nucleoid-associated protein [Myxococcales bacterium]|nr:YbaB/EbfC family nucleoid-associated protein [Myxococcales bacterium]